jgi:hypothetical protein
MPRRAISPIADFAASVDALGSPHATVLVHALVRHLAAHPECAPQVAGSNVRVLHTRGFDCYPPLMLFYTFDDRALYPLHVQPYDLLSAEC